MGRAETQMVMFGATIALDPSDIAQAGGSLVKAIQRKLVMFGVKVTIAEKIKQAPVIDTGANRED